MTVELDEERAEAVATKSGEEQPETAILKKTQLETITAYIKDMDTAIEEMDATSKQLEAFADFYSSEHGVRTLLSEQNTTLIADMPVGFIAAVSEDADSVRVQVTLTLQTLLETCEQNTNPGSLELREKLLSAHEPDNLGAKYTVLARYFCDSAVEDLRSWGIEANVDLLLLRSATTTAAQTMLAQFKPADMLKILSH